LQLSASADAHCDQLIICLFIVSRKTDARFKSQVKLIEFVGTIVTQKYRNIEMVDITVRDLLFYLFSSALVTTNKRIINKPESQPQPIQNGPDSPFYTLLKDPKNRRDAKKLEEKISTINFKDRWTFWTDSVKAQAMSKEDFSKNIHKSGHCSNLKEFCDNWNGIANKLHFGMYSNLRLFKNDIPPLWEDAGNRNGGKWILIAPFTTDPQGDQVGNEALQVFLQISLHMITGLFDYLDNLCGITLAIRPYGIMISIWNNDAGDKVQIISMKKKLTKLEFHNIKYQSHQISIKNNLKKLSDSERTASDVERFGFTSESDNERLMSSDNERGLSESEDESDLDDRMRAKRLPITLTRATRKNSTDASQSSAQSRHRPRTQSQDQGTAHETHNTSSSTDDNAAPHLHLMTRGGLALVVIASAALAAVWAMYSTVSQLNWSQ
jgi:hypothetical protein